MLRSTRSPSWRMSRESISPTSSGACGRPYPGDIAGASGDVKALNAILRENFERFELTSERCGVSAKLVVPAATLQRHVRDDGRGILPAPVDLTITVGAGKAERPAFFAS
jgi:hypothetical protein